jgi:hypothetical protein
MKPLLQLTAAVILVFAVHRSVASDMREELSIDASHREKLRTRFAPYGYWSRQTVFSDVAGFRFRLPGGVAGIPQTGFYSLFALAGDCEVMLTYELLDVPPPRDGYGSGVGLALDLGEGSGRGAIQRVLRKLEGSGCVLQTFPGQRGGRITEVDRFVPTASRRGRIGLRRTKNELIFLSADAPADPSQEIERLPFTDQTIRTLRVFVDPGGSPTSLDVRVNRIEIRAEEIATGVPQHMHRGWGWEWLWVVVSVSGGTLVFWVWRAYRRQEPLKQTDQRRGHGSRATPVRRSAPGEH